MLEYLVIGAIAFIGAMVIYAILDSNGTNRATVNLVALVVWIGIFYLLISNSIFVVNLRNFLAKF